MRIEKRARKPRLCPSTIDESARTRRRCSSRFDESVRTKPHFVCKMSRFALTKRVFRRILPLVLLSKGVFRDRKRLFRSKKAQSDGFETHCPSTTTESARSMSLYLLSRRRLIDREPQNRENDGVHTVIIRRPPLRRRASPRSARQSRGSRRRLRRAGGNGETRGPRRSDRAERPGLP
jgi:hypothetical protein